MKVKHRVKRIFRRICDRLVKEKNVHDAVLIEVHEAQKLGHVSHHILNLIHRDVGNTILVFDEFIIDFNPLRFIDNIVVRRFQPIRDSIALSKRWMLNQLKNDRSYSLKA